MTVPNEDGPRRLLDGVTLRLEQLELPGGDSHQPQYATPRGYGWLGEHQDEAAELVALLHEAAPKLALANLRAPPSAAQRGTAAGLPRARSYDISETTRDRLRAAVPLPTGPGQVDWSALSAVISSELLSYEEHLSPRPSAQPQPPAQPAQHALAAAQVEAALAAEEAALAAAVGSPRSPGGHRLDINSGGRVIFCLFDPPSRAPTPPCSLRNSPDKQPSFIAHAAQLAGAAAVPHAAARSGSPTKGSAAAAGAAPAGAPPHLLRAGSGSSESSLGQCDLLPVASQALWECGDDGAPAAAGASGGSFSFARLPGSAPASPPPLRRLASAAPRPEGCLVLKFVSSRLICQSEQFASELTRHVGLGVPESRILRQKGATEGEWREAYRAAAALRERGLPDLHEEMTRNSCCLVMEFVPGASLSKALPALAALGTTQVVEDLGRLFTLDMLLGNPDRLPCAELGWRGNPENVLFASAGRWAGRAVAIDAVDSACERLAELALNDAEVAGALLRQALEPCGEALAALEPAVLREAATAFQRGLKAALEAAASIKGLLEMMFDVVNDWIFDFIEDIEAANGGGGHHAAGGGSAAHPGASPLPAQLTPRPGGGSRRASSAGAAASPLLLTASAATSAQTMRIRQINHEAQRNDSVGERVEHWKGVFREKGEELRAAVEEWQLKRGSPAEGGQRLTTAFLDGTHPVVDVYELKVRLEHMLQRLRVLQQATLTGRPARLLPRLYLSGAVEASSLHLLRHLGITHILNATEDLLLPDPALGFTTHRTPLRDVEEEDITPHLPDASAFIDEGLASGGGVLVHCHAGKSRSCSLVLAWLMTRRRWPLNRALQFLQRARPEAAPNAGYLAALLRLEEGLFGRQTVKMKKTKPEPRACPECGEKVGLSAESVRVHLRLKHPACALARAGDGSGSWAEPYSPTASSSGSSSHQPSPKSWLAAQPPQRQHHHHHHRRRHQQHQQQPEHAGMGLQADAGAAAPPAAAALEPAHAQAQAPAGSPAPVRTQAAGLAAAAAEAEEAIPESPPSMAAVLRAEAGGPTLVELEGDAEEFLAAAEQPASPRL